MYTVTVDLYIWLPGAVTTTSWPMGGGSQAVPDTNFLAVATPFLVMI